MLSSSTLATEIMDKVRALSGSTQAGIVEHDFHQAFQAVYYASIRREEGEKVLPHVALLSPETMDSLSRYAPILHFHSKQPLSPELLRKLSLAFDRTKSLFLAVPSQGQIVLEGVANWNWQSPGPNFRAPSIPAIRLDAEDSGTLVVHYDRTRLGIFRDGEFHSSRPGIFKSPVFLRCLQSTFFPLASDDVRARDLMRDLEFIVRAAMQRDLGGTVVVTEEWNPALSHSVESGHHVQLAPRAAISGRPIKPDLDFEREYGSSEAEARSALISHFRAIARLSSIDGALILNAKLLPIRFGAKLRSPASQETVFLGGSSENRLGPELRGVGTRHSSALNFVSEAKHSIAFTISSDGPVSAFGWVDDRLSWWKNAVEP